MNDCYPETVGSLHTHRKANEINRQSAIPPSRNICSRWPVKNIAVKATNTKMTKRAAVTRSTPRAISRCSLRRKASASRAWRWSSYASRSLISRRWLASDSRISNGIALSNHSRREMAASSARLHASTCWSAFSISRDLISRTRFSSDLSATDAALSTMISLRVLFLDFTENGFEWGRVP